MHCDTEWVPDYVVCSFEIPTDPLPKERPRVITRRGKSFAYTPQRTRDYERFVAQCAMIAMVGEPVYDGLVIVRADFYRARRTADPDNLMKACMDLMQGIVFANDNQVVELHAIWHRDKENPHALVSVWATSERKGD